MITKNVKTLIYIILDGISIIAAWYLSVWLYSYLFVDEAPLALTIKSTFGVAILINLAVFALLGMYKNLWQYASVGSMIRVAIAVLVSNFLIYIFFRLNMGYWQSPAIPVMAFFISISIISGIRLFSRIKSNIKIFYNEKFDRNMKNAVPTLIVGAGQAASQLILDIKRNNLFNKYNLIACVDDDVGKYKQFLHGIEVIGDVANIPQIVEKLDIKNIIIAIPSATKNKIKTILQHCPTNICKVYLVPNIRDFENYGAGSIREINPTDLLGREETKIDTSSIKKMVENKIVLVTGGGGSIGSEICRQLLKYDVEKIIVFDIYENNAYDLFQDVNIMLGKSEVNKLILRIGSVQDENTLEEIFNEFNIAVVFHAAAYKHVPLMEICPRQAIENNVIGTYKLAKTAKKYNVVKFVMISTDKAVNPTNIMGASKRMAEKVVVSMNEQEQTEFVCVRFGNVLASNGSVIPIFEKQIKNGGPVTVTHREITRYFMTISEAASLVLQAGAMARGGEIFILDMGEPVKITELAENMIKLAGFIPYDEINIEYTGLRPGEKLYEELLTAAEGVTATQNQKIFIAKQEKIDKSYSESLIEDITRNKYNQTEINRILLQNVPEYNKVEENV